MKRFFGEGGLDEEWIRKYCKGDYRRCIRYQMEEKGLNHPDNMLPDGSINESLK